MFPIDDKFIQKYRIEDNSYMQQVKAILDKNEKEPYRYNHNGMLQESCRFGASDASASGVRL